MVVSESIQGVDAEGRLERLQIGRYLASGQRGRENVACHEVVHDRQAMTLDEVRASSLTSKYQLGGAFS